MLRYLRWALFLILAIIVVVFAVNNRQDVVLQYWPGYGIETRLFIVVLLLAAIGFVAGKLSGIIANAKQRHRAREAEHKCTKLEKEVAELKLAAVQAKTKPAEPVDNTIAIAPTASDKKVALGANLGANTATGTTAKSA